MLNSVALARQNSTGFVSNQRLSNKRNRSLTIASQLSQNTVSNIGFNGRELRAQIAEMKSNHNDQMSEMKDKIKEMNSMISQMVKVVYMLSLVLIVVILISSFNWWSIPFKCIFRFAFKLIASFNEEYMPKI